MSNNLKNKEQLKEILTKNLLFFDGGMGTMFQAKGLKPGQTPESLNLTHPELVTEIHSEYLKAGANVITANTFGALSSKHKNYKEMIQAAIQNVKNALSQTRRTAYIALDLGPTGRLLKPMGDLAFEDCVSIYKNSVLTAVECGIDLVIIETLVDGYEAKAAILGVKEACESLPVLCTMTVDSTGKTLTGGDLTTNTLLLEGLRVDALGINCGLGPEQFLLLFDRLRENASIPLIVQPNAGLPEMKDGVSCYNYSAELFADCMLKLAEKGAHILGGCCGTTPLHIQKTIEQCKDLSPKPIAGEKQKACCSYQKAVMLNNDTKISYALSLSNEEVARALQQEDYETLVDLALEESDEFDILNLDLGEGTAKVIPMLQEIIKTPLSFSPSSPEVLEKALRIYNGRPAVTGLQSSGMDAWGSYSAIIQKYGAVLISL